MLLELPEDDEEAEDSWGECRYRAVDLLDVELDPEVEPERLEPELPLELLDPDPALELPDPELPEPEPVPDFA